MMRRMSLLSAEDSFLQHRAGLMEEAAYGGGGRAQSLGDTSRMRRRAAAK